MHLSLARHIALIVALARFVPGAMGQSAAAWAFAAFQVDFCETPVNSSYLQQSGSYDTCTNLGTGEDCIVVKVVDEDGGGSAVPCDADSPHYAISLQYTLNKDDDGFCTFFHDPDCGGPAVSVTAESGVSTNGAPNCFEPMSGQFKSFRCT